MNKSTLSGGTAHKIPNDLSQELRDTDVAKQWEDITSLARNDFICWVEDAKQDKTRVSRIRRTCEELADGERRPCCWSGCIHRDDKEPSPSQKFINKLG
jgi:uncharacterized protein YdeI (YjbR/CyaY-like superfamily)